MAPGQGPPLLGGGGGPWIGRGFSAAGSMWGSQAVIGLIDGGTVLKYDLTDDATVADGARQTLTGTSIKRSQDGGTVVMEFAKLLVEEGEVPIISSGDDGGGAGNSFLHARGSGDGLGYHDVRVSFVVDLAADDAPGAGEGDAGDGTSAAETEETVVSLLFIFFPAPPPPPAVPFVVSFLTVPSPSRRFPIIRLVIFFLSLSFSLSLHLLFLPSRAVRCRRHRRRMGGHTRARDFERRGGDERPGPRGDRRGGGTVPLRQRRRIDERPRGGGSPDGGARPRRRLALLRHGDVERPRGGGIPRFGGRARRSGGHERADGIGIGSVLPPDVRQRRRRCGDGDDIGDGSYGECRADGGGVGWIPRIQDEPFKRDGRDELRR